MYNNSAFACIIAASIGLIIVFLIIAIVFYVLAALGLYKLAQNEGIENPWLAWVPFGNLYIVGRLVKTVKLFNYDIPSLELVLPIGAIAVAILGGIPLLGTLLSIAFMIVLYVTLYNLYKKYRPQSATLWIILSIVLGLFPIFIFIMRNDRPVA
jgi:uncharacterized membrane protein